MGTQKETVALTVTTEAGQAIQQTKSLKQELRDATRELQNMLKEGKENTAEFSQARLKVAGLKDSINDLNAEIKGLDKGQRLQAVAGVASGITGGFEAAAGAMALFGTESKEVQASLLKVQGAMALAQGVDQIINLGDSFKVAKVAIQATASQFLTYIGVVEGATAAQIALTIATKAFQALTSPLGLAFTALTAGVAYFANSIYGLSKAREKEIEASKKQIEQHNAEQEALNKATQAYVASTQARDKRLAQLNIDRQQGREKELAQLKLNFENQTKEIANNGLSIAAKREEFKIAEEIYLKEKAAINKKYDDEEIKRLKEKKAKLEQQHQERIKQLYEESFEIQASEEANSKALNDITKKAFEENTKIKEDEYNKQQKLQAEIDFANKTARHTDLEHAKLTAQQKADATIGSSEQTLLALSAIGNALIKDSEKRAKFERQIAIAQVGLDLARAISQTIATANSINAQNVATGGAAGIIQMATNIAAIITSGAKAYTLLKTPIPSAGGSLSTATTAKISTPQQSNTTPNLNRIEGTNVDRGSFNDIGNATIKAVVVEAYDITKTQNRIQTIEQRARR